MNIPLLIMLFACHYICDYSHLSTPKMLAAKRVGAPYYPILLHASVHGFAMAAVMILVGVRGYSLWLPFFIQIGTHFAIDVLKGKCNVWFPVVTQPQKNPHWYVFGLDQLLHQLVIIFMWYLTLKIK